ncbi:MAG: hypothetical protein AVDCRST_MAG68-3968 [uncultured Gemmatimonadetes bacterium]|uniref:Uncharacterized protein n=1 Tax=uncultured Gemmatimonadota bacterium TaxID=203437 RepID=A0A6J4M0G6_9BACT|nr:MAG: hypothetical protein AVDCRST_MAG68-3968 [uncultured Gemmatimonadota bacterium]
MATDSALRRILLTIYFIGLAGLAAELFLLEHFGDVWQWVPLGLLAAGLLAGLALALRPGRAVVLAFRAVMAAFVAAGAVGAYLHLRGNVEFELESDPTLRGAALLWEALQGATPALAPGALAQLGLVGLALAYRHPALNPSNTGNR